MQAGDNYRSRQVSFWKKHQTMVQLCADLTTRCGAKVLVSIIIRLSMFWRFSNQISLSLQCIITMPDGVVANSDIVQIMDEGKELKISITNGGTVIFDSFSPEHEVRRRNVNRNNISKLNHMPSRFPASFKVDVNADSVAAVLCAETVSDYKVVDKRTNQAITASDRRPDSTRAPHEVNSKHKISEISSDIKALIAADTEDESAKQTRQADTKRKRLLDTVEVANIPQYHHSIASTVPSTRIREPLQQCTPYYNFSATDCMIVQQHYTPSAFDHPGLPRCSLNFQDPVHSLPSATIHGGTMADGYRNNLKALVEAAERSYIEAASVMNFTSTSRQSPTSEGECNCVDANGNKIFPPSLISNDPLVEQQPDPLFDINSLLKSRPGTSSSDSIQVVLCPSDIHVPTPPTTQESEILLEMSDIADSSKAAEVLQGIKRSLVIQTVVNTPPSGK